MEDDNDINNIEEEDLRFIKEIINMSVHKKILLQEIIMGCNMEEQKKENIS